MRPAGEDLSGCAAAVIGGPEAWRRLRVWRAAGARLGVVVVHAADPPDDRAALEPVVHLRHAGPEEMADALRAVSGTASASGVALPTGHVDLVRQRFHPHAGPDVELTGLEARLVGYLAARSDRVVSRDELQRQVWDHRKPLRTRAIDVAVARLRAKIDPEGRAKCLVTVRGEGYRLVAPASPGPAATTELIGRDALLADLAERLRAPGAAVALIGPPGVGKSAIARATARLLGGRLADLEGARDADALAALAAALREPIPPSGDRAGGLLDRLGDGLLVLDHAEGSSLIAELVPRLAERGARLLVASQERFAEPGLTTVSVPLLTPESTVALLLARAPSLSAEDAGRLAPALDGLPLVVELAAALAATVGPDVLADPGDRLRILSDGSDPRRSLAAAVERAWARATEQDRDTLVRLCAFQGRFRLSWARAHLGADAVARLASLAGRSLLQRDGEGYRVLPVVRAWVQANAAPGPPYPAWLARHTDALWERLLTSEARAAWAELADLFPDLCAALLTSPAADAGSLVGGVDAVLLATGTVAERERWLEVARARGAADLGSRVWVEVLWAGLLVNRAPNEAAARLAGLPPHPDPGKLGHQTLLEAHCRGQTAGPHAARAALARVDLRSTPPRIRGRVLASLTVIREQLGEQSTDRTADDLASLSRSLLDAGLVADGVYVGVDAVLRLQTGDRRRAAALLHELVANAPLLHDPRMVGQLHATLAIERIQDGRPDDALASLDAAYAAFARSDPARCNQAELLRGLAHHAARRHEAARAVYHRVLAWSRSVGYRWIEAQINVRLAELELDAGQRERGVQHAEAAVALQAGLSDHRDASTRMTLAAALLIAGRPRDAVPHVAAVEPQRLTPWDRLEHAMLRAALAMDGDRSKIEAALRDVPGTPGELARRLLGDGTSMDAATGAEVREGPFADVRRLLLIAEAGEARSAPGR